MAKDTNKLAVVAAAGSGVGRAPALALSHKRLTVLAAGRRLQPLKETADSAVSGDKASKGRRGDCGRHPAATTTHRYHSRGLTSGYGHQSGR